MTPRMVRMDGALRASLEALLAQLPVVEDRRDWISMEAEGLYLAAGFASVNDLPRARKVGSKVARRELDKLAKLSIALEHHILSMHRDSLSAIEMQKGGVRHPLIIADDLRKLIAAVKLGENVLVETPANRDLHAKHHAAGVTSHAARLFERLTGKPATRTSESVWVNRNTHGSQDGGEFHSFLKDVFRLLRVDASPSGQLKTLKEKARQKRGS